MSEFNELKRQVRANFDVMAKDQQLFYVGIDRTEVWDAYLDGFSDEERQGHNCNCCKSFLRQYAGIVGIINGNRVSIWDNLSPPDIFINSMQNVREYVAARPITDVFYNEFAKCGTDKNLDKELNTTWNHFYIHLDRKFVVKDGSIDSKRGKYKMGRGVFERSLKELTLDAVDTVLELIAQNSIYRGASFKNVVESFRKVKVNFDALPEGERELYTWKFYGAVSNPVATIKNSAIGTLLVDLSDQMELDKAVARYEDKVSSGTYKRPTALVTPRMIEMAKEKLTEMGLLDSLDRRHAVSTDLNVENLLFIDKSSELSDGFSEMTKDAKAVVNPKTLKAVEEITIEKFISDVLPKAKSVELLLDNSHLGKFVSLMTGDNKDAPTLFKWDNLFSWSYTGGITDTIKERVKAAGGQIIGELRMSLSWYNYDDLDIHVVTPSGNKIFYSNKRDSRTGGNLDVDMNAGGRRSRTPVENIIFPTKDKMEEGTYEVRVNQYSKRETVDVGYDIQIEHDGQITDIHKPKSPQSTDVVCKIKYSKKDGITFDKRFDSKLSTKEKWGLKTNEFIKVKSLLLSPNCWNGKTIGNKHYMFMLEDCINDEKAKPFFNEFMKSEFDENRKVFEVMNGKFPVPPAKENQVSGVGFSETIAGEVILRVEGKFKRLLKIKF